MTERLTINQTVWIHLNGPALHAGTVSHKFELDDKELYVITVTTEIEPVYEVRSYHEVSLTSAGPIHAFKKLGDDAKKYLTRLGIDATEKTDTDEYDPDEPSQAVILAALEGKPMPAKEKKPARRYYRKNVKLKKS